MNKVCKRISRTVEEYSILFDKIYDIVKNEELADSLYGEFNEQHFKDRFGDYQTYYLNVKGNKNAHDPEFNKRLDDNFEPKLFFDNVLNKHYYLDKYNERFYFPPGKQGLSSYLSVNNIKTYARSLALSYYKDYFKFDFDNLEFKLNPNKKQINLKDYVEYKLNSKADTMITDLDLDTMMLGVKLSETTNMVLEWVNEVKDFYKSIKTEISEDIIENQEETTRDDLVRIESFLKSSKDAINNNVKLFLSTIEGKELNEFGEPEFIPFDDIYATLNKSLANKIALIDNNEDLYQLNLNEIKQLSLIKPYFNDVYDLLNDGTASDNFKNQFVSAFNLFKNNYLGSEISKDGKSYIVRNLSEVGSRKSNILLQWYHNYTLQVASTPNILRAIDEDAKKAFQAFNKNYSKIQTLDEVTNFKNDLKTILNKLGVELTKDGFDYFLNNLQNSESNIENIKKQIRLSYKKILSAISDNKGNIDGNIFKSESSLFSKISEAEAFFFNEGSDASIFSLGKTKWAYSNPSFLDLKIAEWKKNPQLLIDYYEAKKYTNSSHWLYYLTAADITDKTERLNKAKENLSKIEVNIFNSIQQEGNAINGSDTKNLSKTDSLVDYMNKLLGYRKGAKTYHKTALAADKSTEYQIFFGNNIDYFNIETSVKITENGIEIISDKTLDIFYKYFKGEYERIREVFKEIDTLDPKKLIPNYHTGKENGKHSQLFPTLKDKIKLFDQNGKPLYTNLDQIKDQVISEINKSLGEGIKATYDRLNDNEIFTFDNFGRKANNLLDNAVYESYNTQYKNAAFHHVAADMFINSVISQVEYSKMFTGDVAYYKNMSDYKKRVPATYSDGLYMRLTDSKDKYFNASVIAGVEIGYQDIDELPKNIQSYYKEAINTTDAQAWITPERWKFIMKGLGKWTKVTESTYNKMVATNPKKFNKKELKLLAQPLKGIYFDNIKGRPIYLKYSQAVLLPNMIKGTQLQKLYDKMVTDESGKKLPYDKQIHELITKDGVKVGYPQPEVTHDDKGNIIDEFNLNKVQLSNNNWKLQQDLPVKGVKDTELGSQIQKNIFQGLAFTSKSTFYMGGNEYTNEQLIDAIHEVTKGLSDIGLDEVKSMLGVDSDFKIKNENKLYSSIIKQLKNRSGTPNNVIKALEARTSPYGIPGALNTFQNVFSSTINKHTVKIKTNGASFIQMSDYGLNRDEAVEQGIKFTPWFDDTKLKMPTPYKDDNGNTKYKPGGIFISGAMLSKYIPDYENIPNDKLFGTKKNGYKGMIDKKILDSIIGYRIPNQGLSSNDALEVMGILPPGQGDTVVAYTGITTKTGSDFDIDKMFMMIPSFDVKYPDTDLKKGIQYINQADLSNLELQEELEENGWSKNKTNLLNRKELERLFVNNILLEPSAISNYNEDFASNSNLLGAESLKYVEYDESKPANEQTKKALQNRLIEIYKSILTNKDVIEDVLSPVDEDFMELDIKNSNPNTDAKDLLDFDAIHDIDIKNEFMLGKAGLGQNVNQLVDSVRGSLGDISFNNYYLGWGIVNEKGNSKFDSEYSENLTDKEIADYIKYSNKEASSQISKSRLETSLKKLKLSKSMMTLVNGFVDIAKDSYIVKGNWVTQTNNVGFMLIRAGVHPFKVNAFLGQPILKEYINYRNNRESNSINDTNLLKEGFAVKRSLDFIKNKYKKDRLIINGLSFEYDNIFRTIVNKEDIFNLQSKHGKTDETKYTDLKYLNAKKLYIDKLYYKTIKKFNLKTKDLDNNPKLFKEFNDFKNNHIIPYFEKNFELEKLPFNKITLGEMKKNMNNIEDPQFQHTILEQFNDWQQRAKKLSNGVNASKVDVNGKGKDIMAAIIAANKIRNIFQNQNGEGELYGFMSKFKKNDLPTILKTYLDNSVGFSQKLMQANPKYFVLAQPKVIETFNTISHHIYDESLVNETLADKLQKDYYTYIMSGFKPLQINDKAMLAKLPVRFTKMKKKLNNPLLNELFIKPSSTKGLDIITMSNVKKSASYKNTLTDAWNELLESEPEFAEDLIKYSFAISGFNNSLNQFHEYIPYEWFNANGFNSYLKKVNLAAKDVDNGFIDHFFRHRLDDDSLSKQLQKNSITPLRHGVATYSAFVVLKDKFKKLKTPPYITRKVTYSQFDTSGKGVKTYYKYAGVDSRNNHVYTLVEPLGFKDKKANKFIEFDINYNHKLSESKKSQYDTNHIPRVDNALINKIQLEHDYGRPTANDKDLSEFLQNNFYSNYDAKESQAISNPDIGLDVDISESLEALYNENKEVLLKKDSNMTIEIFKKSFKNYEMEEIKEYIKNCY